MRKSNKAGKRIGQAVFSTIETLEQRRLLSSSVTSTLVPNGDGTNTLQIEGTKNKDYINVYDDPDESFFAVVNDKNHNGVDDMGEETDFTDQNINVVFIDAKQGDDTVTYNLMDSYDGDQRSIEVDLSDGNDKFTFSSPTETNPCQPVQCQASPEGADITDHSSINMEIEGQEKNDTIDVDLTNTSVENSELLVNVDAGSGNDKVSFEAPEEEHFIGDSGATGGSEGGASDYTQVQLQVDLGSGNNLYSQDLFTEIDYAELTVNVNGGTGKDTVQAEDSYSLEDGAAYSFTANLGSGNDYYNGELGFNEVAEGSEVTYNLQGGDGNDRMTLEGNSNEQIRSGAVLPAIQETEFFVNGIFTVNMYGGNGNDTIDMWADEDGSQPFAVNSAVQPHGLPVSPQGGNIFPMFIETDEDGSVRVVLSGDYGNDKVGLFLGAGERSEGDYDLSVLGAAGKDTVAAGFADDTLDPDSGVTFGPSGAILLDGGRDKDTYEAVSYNDASTDPVTLLTPFDIRAVEVASLSLLPPLI